MHDRTGAPLAVGDKVVILGTVTALSPTPDYCNVTVETTFCRKPDDAKECLSGINTNVLVKVGVALLTLLVFSGMVSAQDPKIVLAMALAFGEPAASSEKPTKPVVNTCGCTYGLPCTCVICDCGFLTFKEGYEQAMKTGKLLCLFVGQKPSKVSGCIIASTDSYKGDKLPRVVVMNWKDSEMFVVTNLFGVHPASTIKLAIGSRNGMLSLPVQSYQQSAAPMSNCGPRG